MEIELASLTWNGIDVLHDGGGQYLWNRQMQSSKYISLTWRSQKDFEKLL